MRFPVFHRSKQADNHTRYSAVAPHFIYNNDVAPLTGFRDTFTLRLDPEATENGEDSFAAMDGSNIRQLFLNFHDTECHFMIGPVNPSRTRYKVKRSRTDGLGEAYNPVGEPFYSISLEINLKEEPSFTIYLAHGEYPALRSKEQASESLRGAFNEWMTHNEALKGDSIVLERSDEQLDSKAILFTRELGSFRTSDYESLAKLVTTDQALRPPNNKVALDAGFEITVFQHFNKPRSEDAS